MNKIKKQERLETALGFIVFGFAIGVLQFLVCAMISNTIGPVAMTAGIIFGIGLIISSVSYCLAKFL